MTAPYGFEICTHIILNLPGDDIRDVIDGKDPVSTSGTDRKTTFIICAKRFQTVQRI